MELVVMSVRCYVVIDGTLDDTDWSGHTFPMENISALTADQASVGMPATPSFDEQLPGTPARGGIRPVIRPALDAEQIADGAYI